MDVYMSEEAVNSSPIRELLMQWEADGWLTIVPKENLRPFVAREPHHRIRP